MIFLKDVSEGRDNNLNLIRAFAATAVLVSHAYPIALGPDAEEPLEALTGRSLGALSVFAFFTISGFLISMSFIRSSSWQGFLVARFLRLLPGLVVSLLLVAFLLGPLVTTLSLGAYFSDPQTYGFLIRNTTLVFLQYQLPGVFETQPYPSVEGSIWTLIYEVACYMGVFVLGIIGMLKSKTWMALGFVVYLGVWLLIEIYGTTIPRLGPMQNLSLPFAMGMAFYIWRDKLPLSIIGVIVLAVLAWALKGTVFYDLGLTLALSYAVFWLAYIPGGILRAYNRLGDYSYGIYIYAFPLQGFAVWWLGTQTPLLNMLISFPLTLLLSVLSWHLVEEPAMRLKSRLVAVLRPQSAAP